MYKKTMIQYRETLEEISALKGAVSPGQQGMTREHWPKKKFGMFFYVFFGQQIAGPENCKTI